MTDFNRKLAVELIQQGISPKIAVVAASEATRDFHISWIVEPTGSLGDTPDPACVARHLKGIEKPTRQEIERALDLCSR
jgi:hypothetical protein